MLSCFVDVLTTVQNTVIVRQIQSIHWCLDRSLHIDAALVKCKFSLRVILYVTRKETYVKRNIVADSHDDLDDENTTVLSFILFKYASLSKMPLTLKNWNSTLPCDANIAANNMIHTVGFVRIKQSSYFHNSHHYQISWKSSNWSPLVYADRRTWRN